jgi:hypothetical protein
LKASKSSAVDNSVNSKNQNSELINILIYLYILVVIQNTSYISLYKVFIIYYLAVQRMNKQS